MLSIGLLLALAQATPSHTPSKTELAATQRAGCEGCSAHSWQFRNAKWYWWDGGRFTYYWHTEQPVRLPGIPKRASKPTRPPSMKLQLKPTPTVAPHRAP
ncbi:MAG: hypothetical protein EOP62_09270 [Sphingomonadales bacterium]|nr:MAG: hypothetical protein EOP62_09270 [Sphingomonadales bacterium]